MVFNNFYGLAMSQYMRTSLAAMTSPWHARGAHAHTSPTRLPRSVDVVGVGLVAVDLDGDRVVHGVVDIGDREDDRAAVRDVVGVPCGKGGRRGGGEGKRVRREEKKPRAEWFGYPPPRNFSTKSESIVVVTPMVAMEEAMDSNVNPS